MSSEEIYTEYMSRWRNSLSVMYIDTENDLMMSDLIPKMEKAIKENTPLDDSIFGIPDSTLI